MPGETLTCCEMPNDLVYTVSTIQGSHTIWNTWKIEVVIKQSWNLNILKTHRIIIEFLYCHKKCLKATLRYVYKVYSASASPFTFLFILSSFQVLVAEFKMLAKKHVSPA